ncbi:MAG: tetratricopeptide repeat protein [Bacteroidales bacterium]|nr:tetratricopeptide repeat protein [Bacteroidales bacterium]
METNHNREELIDLYLLDKLSSQARKDFEEEMLKNDDLRKEVEVMQRILIGFEHKGETEAIHAMRTMPEEQVKSIIANAENEYKPKVNRIGLYSVIAGIAASIALLLYIGFKPKYSSEELYNDFYVPFAYEYIPSRGGILNGEEEHLLEQAISGYNQERYAEALALLDSITKNIHPEQVPEEVMFYTALSMAETGKENSAVEKLESIASSNDSEFKEDAQWNLALLYLKLGERNKSSTILRVIIDSKDNPYAGDAGRLLDKLNTKKWF